MGRRSKRLPLSLLLKPEIHTAMKSRSLTMCLHAIIAMLCFGSCVQNKRLEASPFALPRIPISYNLDQKYLKIDLEDTLYRVDSLGQKVHISIKMLDRKAAKLWRIDTMHFKFKNLLSSWDFQKRGYYWTFQDLTSSTNYNSNASGKLYEVYNHLNENFLFHPVRQPEKGQTYPGIDYKVMDEYWCSLQSDAVGISNPTDGDVFVIAHPILKKKRVQDYYSKTLQGDSIAIPSYSDRVDSSKLICLRISLLQLNQ